MKIGKISNELLNEIIFSKIKYKHKDVLAGSGLAEDCSLIKFSDEICVISTDPITATTSNIGELSVLISGNDVATKGVKTFGILVTILAPPSTELDELKTVITDIIETANNNEIQLIGGHTEVTDAVNRIVISTTCLGKGKRSEIVYDREVLPGDQLIMTKYGACEGTVILYDDFKGELDELLNDKDREELAMLKKMISVSEEGAISGKHGAKYMHDVTEGGILGAVWEVCEKFKRGATIDKNKIPLLSATKKITGYFNMDPLKLISSGVMLIAADRKTAAKIIMELEGRNIKADIIGEFTEKNCYIKDEERLTLIDPPQSDDLYLAYHRKGEKNE
ncbi:MAG: AIR synthase [Eubacteriaceae bacterium]|nr:AIR synthase [Eubacteriaceae bacterium]